MRLFVFTDSNKTPDWFSLSLSLVHLSVASAWDVCGETIHDTFFFIIFYKINNFFLFIFLKNYSRLKSLIKTESGGLEKVHIYRYIERLNKICPFRDSCTFA